MDGNEPEFITFLRKLPEFQLYPVNKIPTNKPKICAFTYFRVGVVICENSNDSDFIVVVKTVRHQLIETKKKLKKQVS